jgi:hypothetical protein
MNTEQRQPERWGVFCTVSGGATGSRSSWLKGADGELAVFASKAGAEAQAARLMQQMNGPNARASFTYRAAELDR